MIGYDGVSKQRFRGTTDLEEDDLYFWSLGVSDSEKADLND